MDEYDLADNGSSNSNPSWLNTFNSLASAAGTGVKTYQAISGKGGATPTLQRTGGSPTTPSSSNWQKYLPWAIGGVVVLFLLGFVVSRK